MIQLRHPRQLHDSVASPGLTVHGEPVSRIGDRTPSRYRSMARKALGDGAVQAAPPADPVRAVLGEVLDEFERVQLLL